MGDRQGTECNRLQSLDTLRGLAVAGMIVVTSPGAWDISYAPLRHAEWQGWTLADIVFPTFLFAVGMAFALSFPRMWGAEDRALAWRRIARRTALLILLGLLLNALPYFDLSHLRIPGILQRIAVCYALVAALSLLTLRRDADGRADLNPIALGIAAAVLLAVYWALLAFVPVPGFGAGQFDSAGNLPGYVDRAIFTVPHLWPYGTTGKVVTYDPEGVLSTLGAIINVLVGALAAILWRKRPGPAPLAIVGAVLLVLGLLLDPVLPMIKRLWTDSFALFSSGFSLLLLALLTAAEKAPLVTRALAPLRVLGRNAILAFTLQQFWAAFNSIPWVNDAQGRPRWPHNVMMDAASTILPDPYLASLACALVVLAAITLLIVPLDRRGIRLRL